MERGPDYTAAQLDEFGYLGGAAELLANMSQIMAHNGKSQPSVNSAINHEIKQMLETSPHYRQVVHADSTQMFGCPDGYPSSLRGGFDGWFVDAAFNTCTRFTGREERQTQELLLILQRIGCEYYYSRDNLAELYQNGDVVLVPVGGNILLRPHDDVAIHQGLMEHEREMTDLYDEHGLGEWLSPYLQEALETYDYARHEVLIEAPVLRAEATSGGLYDYADATLVGTVNAFSYQHHSEYGLQIGLRIPMSDELWQSVQADDLALFTDDGGFFIQGYVPVGSGYEICYNDTC